MTDECDTVARKEVTVVGYAEEQHKDKSVREFGELVTGQDLTSYETEETKYHSIVFKDDSHVADVRRSITVPEYEQDKMADVVDVVNSNCEGVEIEVNVEREKDYINHPYQAARDTVRSLEDRFPEQLPSGLVRIDYRDTPHLVQIGWGLDGGGDGESKVHIQDSRIEEMRVLSKEQNRESDDLYETVSKRPCISLVVNIEAEGDGWDEVVDGVTENLIPKVVKEMSSLEGVGKVRFMGCEVTEKKKGECYNI